MTNRKVILICIDGLRADAVKACGNPYIEELEKICTYTYTAQTVMPSSTMPAHMSLVLSVPPEKHKTFTNLYVLPERPSMGLFERLAAGKRTSAMFYNWEPIRDISRPNSMRYTTYISAGVDPHTDKMLADEAEKLMGRVKPDMVFLYLVETDAAGHFHGWMGPEYMEASSIGFDIVKRMIERFGDEYTVIVMADHGGHEKDHGKDIPEDMTIPLFFYGPDFEKGKEIDGVSIMDIAPTITAIMGINPDAEWEGKSII